MALMRDSGALLSSTPQNLFEYEALARQILPLPVWDYYSSGAGDEITLRENRAAFERLHLFYRVLVDVSGRSLETTVLGERIGFPALIAPTAFHKLAHPEGELATTRAAGAAGTIMILSTLSNTRVEDVMAVATGPVWFQLYVYRDRGATKALVERVARAGCRALVITVDAPLLGRRERDARNQFALPPGLGIENMLPVGLGDLPKTATDSGLAAYFAEMLDPTLSWKDIEWLAGVSGLPLVLKGVVRADDAVRAAQHGVAAVVVSNHGGRQLDTSPPTIEALPAIAEAIGNRAEVLLDGGVRRGVDIVKALALGASAVLVGRPVLWGLAAAGEAGVTNVLEILKTELDLAFALAGCRSVQDVGRDLLGK
jgi:4-hydroxymandelate oxidase